MRANDRLHEPKRAICPHFFGEFDDFRHGARPDKLVRGEQVASPHRHICLTFSMPMGDEVGRCPVMTADKSSLIDRELLGHSRPPMRLPHSSQADDRARC